MMLAIILAVLGWEAYSLTRGSARPGWGLVNTLAGMAVVVVIARGADWNGGLPFVLWPVIGACTAVLVGVRAARFAAARMRPAPRPEAP